MRYAISVHIKLYVGIWINHWSIVFHTNTPFAWSPENSINLPALSKWSGKRKSKRDARICSRVAISHIHFNSRALYQKINICFSVRFVFLYNYNKFYFCILIQFNICCVICMKRDRVRYRCFTRFCFSSYVVCMCYDRISAYKWMLITLCRTDN